MQETPDHAVGGILAEILTWSASRPVWQRDALRRILEAGGVTREDLDELEEICRKVHGIGTEAGELLAAVPLGSVHIGGCGAAAGQPLSLVAVKNLKHVNRIPGDTELSFGPSPGLTVVFGPNGAGKSGYARVLKKACQSRGAPPEIHPNAHLPKPTEPASAEILAMHGTAPVSHAWVDGFAPDGRLAQVFVFDSATADNYLSADGPTSFTPFGLDVLPKLSQVCDRIRERLEREKGDLEARCQQTAAGWSVAADTQTGAFLRGLSAGTSPEAIDAVTAFNSEDERTQAELEATLKADPRQKAKETRASADRIEHFVGQCEVRMTHFSQEALTRLGGRIRSVIEAEKAAKAFSERRFPDGVLPGTGGELWKRLWDAAQGFSVSAAYPGLPFPPPAGNDGTVRCVLCQQDLSPEARNRFAEFAVFMADQSQKLAAEARDGLAAIVAKLEAMPLLADEAKRIEADVGDALVAAVNAFASTSDLLLATVRDHIQRSDPTPHAPVSLDVTPLKNLVQQLRERAIREEAALDPAKREGMLKQLADLQARATASRRRPDIVAHVQALKRSHALSKCITDTSTAAITRRSTELTEQVVTQAYLTAFDTKLDDLGLKTIEVRLTKVPGKKGEARYGLRLKTANVGPSLGPSEVASEGEQRCITLAAFLAELSQASHLSALIFDDPVSSLDHNYRMRVAGVLAEEATRRQVIVFTHDLVFLHDLGAATEEKGVALTPRSIEWGAGGPGVCRDDVPWEGKKVAERLDELGKRQRAVARACTGLPNQEQAREILDIYAHLRATLERTVEDRILDGALTRYQNQVKIGKLRGLVGFSQGEFDEIARLHTRCSEVIPAHDSATARQVCLPSAVELGKDIADACVLLDLIKTRKAAVAGA